MDIYKITNLINSKVYIGKTSNLKKRSSKHLNGHSGSYIATAIKKHGKENFFIKVIESDLSDDEANDREIYWIGHYRSTDRNIGYNLTFGGDGMRATKETKKKLSASLKGMWSGAKHPMFGRTHTEEAKLRISAAHKGRVPTLESNMLRSKAMKGKIFSDEHKANISAARKGIRPNDVSMLRKPKSEIHKLHMRESGKNKKGARLISFNGDVNTIAECGRRFDISPETLKYRLDNGWTVETALTTLTRGLK